MYVHVPLIVGEDGKKLSKRNGDASFADLIEKGYLPEAIVNYIALLGWSPGGEREIFSMKELEEVFDYRNISKSPAVFDLQKLTWMNGEYIRSQTPEQFFALAKPYLIEAIHKPEIDLRKVANLLQSRTDMLPQVVELADFFEALPEYDIAIYTHKKMKTNPENSVVALENMLLVLQRIAEDEWIQVNIHAAVMELVAKLECKNGQVLWPLRTALTGKPVSPGGAFEVAEILGKAESLRRIRVGIDMLKDV